MKNKKPQLKDKMFIIRKYVMAKDAAEAIKKAPKTPVHDVFIDDDWRKNQNDCLAEAIGFHIEISDDE